MYTASDHTYDDTVVVWHARVFKGHKTLVVRCYSVMPRLNGAATTDATRTCDGGVCAARRRLRAFEGVGIKYMCVQWILVSRICGAAGGRAAKEKYALVKYYLCV